MNSSFGSGRLDAGWLDETTKSEWLLETIEPFDAGHRDAFIGNGFIGQRLGIEGDASAYPLEGHPFTPSGCLVHGLWNETGLMAPPNWALLHYFDGTARFGRGVGVWRDYRQSLDLRTGIVRTELFWVNGERITHLVTRAYIDRCNSGRCVISRTITPQFSGNVGLTDEIDGTFIDDAAGWDFFQSVDPHEALSMELRMGPRDRRVALVSRLAFEEGFITEKQPSILHPSLPVNVELHASDKKAGRTVSFAVEAGRSYTITKVVALIPDNLAPAPRIAAKALAEAGAFDPYRMEQAHLAAWGQVWEHRIEVSHSRLQLLLNSALYQFYANLREGGVWSLGPTGLSANAWCGHVFWDSDLWMFPGICLLNPGLAKGFVDYRTQTRAGAHRNAQAAGYDGVCIAWESAEFGDEVIPQLIYHYEHHVNSAVALAQWWYWKITGDDNWFREKGAPLIIESAKFWASRVVYVEEHDRYEILQVCCADEYAEVRDNNAHTNFGAVKTLELAMAASSFLGRPFPPAWRDIASKMWIPRDNATGNILEYEGYAGQTIKQADTALLVYPYEMPMSDTLKANIVDYYRTKYPEGHIMMASAIDGIVDCELGRPELGWQSMLKLLPHFREPFLLVSESPANETASFMTGLGGLLQLILMGFAGIRIHENGLQVHPQLPRAFDRMTIHGVHYGGIGFDLEIKGGKVNILRPSGPILFQICNARGESWM